MGCDVLIGMDLIGQGDFAITNFEGNTTLSFGMPSCIEIDFVKEINEYNKKNISPEDRRKLRNKNKAEKRKHR